MRLLVLRASSRPFWHSSISCCHRACTLNSPIPRLNSPTVRFMSIPRFRNGRRVTSLAAPGSVPLALVVPMHTPFLRKPRFGMPLDPERRALCPARHSEIAALTQAFRASTSAEDAHKGLCYCAIGSVKTNIGHLDAAISIGSPRAVPVPCASI